MRRSTSRSRGVSWSSSGSKVTAAPAGGGGVGGEGVEDEAGQAGREHGVAVGHPDDGLGELGPRDGLGHVAARPGPDDADDVLGGVGHRQGQEADVGMDAADGLDDGLAAAVGHVHVDEDDVGDPLADELDGRRHLVGLPHHLDLGTELGPHPGPEEPVVVDQEDPQASARCSSPGSSAPWA